MGENKLKRKKLKYLVQKRMDKKTPGSSDFMNTQIESLIDVIAPLIQDEDDRARLGISKSNTNEVPEDKLKPKTGYISDILDKIDLIDKINKEDIFNNDVEGYDIPDIITQDRNHIYRIMSEMLDNPDSCGLYQTTKAFNELEKLVNDARLEAAGWTWALACTQLDYNIDPREYNQVNIIEQIQKDLNPPYKKK